jgi:colicin import membrane protein
MTTAVAGTLLPIEPPDDDPFRYGWRYVQRELPDGNLVVEQLPLTLEDVLHPEEGDQVTHSAAHQRRIRYLCNVFGACLAADPSAVVLDDVRIAWDVPELKPHGPDIMVIFGVRERKNWSTFDVAAEGVRPALIVEVTSPETASIDRSNKLDEYDLAGVPLYIIVDTVQRRGQPVLRLLGYRQTPGAYEPLIPDERGWLWIESLGLWLGIADNELHCFDADGVQLGDYTEINAALETERVARREAEARAQTEVEARREAEARAQSEADARTALEIQLQEMEAELKRLRGDTEGD